jgi:hypothetical protein
MELLSVETTIAVYNCKLTCVRGTVFCYAERPEFKFQQVQEIFSLLKCPDRFLGSSNFLFNWYKVYFPGLKLMGCEVYY